MHGTSGGFLVHKNNDGNLGCLNASFFHLIPGVPNYAAAIAAWQYFHDAQPLYVSTVLNDKCPERIFGLGVPFAWSSCLPGLQSRYRSMKRLADCGLCPVGGGGWGRSVEGKRKREAPCMMPVDCVWNVMAHAQKPDFVFWRNGRIHLTLMLLTWKIRWAHNNASKWQMGCNSALKGLNRRGRQFSRLLAAEVCPSAVVMLNTPCSEVVWRVLDTHSIRQFLLHFPSRASPCAITSLPYFQF
jgi:hypothetical protein